MSAEQSQIEPFDLQRLLIGDYPLGFLAEVITRSAIMFTFSFCMLRMLGKRGIGELSIFHFAMIIALGSAVGDPMFHVEDPLLPCMVVVSTVVLCERGFSYLTRKSMKVEGALEGFATEMVSDGIVRIDHLNTEELSQQDLFMLLREEGIENLSKVRKAYLEQSGGLSVFLFQ